MNRIRALREDSDMKQADLAKMLGCTPITISRYELEQRALTPDLICRLCDIFHVTADYLLCRTTMPTAAVSEEEAELLCAYRAADERARAMVELALEPYSRRGEVSAPAAKDA